MIPNRGLLEYPAMITTQALAPLTIEDDHVFILLSFLYAGID